ncbi:MAG: ATP-binding protein [Tepidisphaeraceae bacterium]
MKASTDDPVEIMRGLEVVERNARTQAQIIDDLLDMSRIISGKIRLEMQPIDLLAVVRAAVDTVTPAADAKGITLSCEANTNEGRVFGDANRLQQVFWNLLSNAIKFTPPKGQVGVRTRVIRSGFEVSITDSGEGIAPHFLPHVFDRFRQADASTTRKHGGLGLGLSIVKQLIEIHGGTVDVTSDGLGQGATFSVRLPTATSQAATNRPGRSGSALTKTPEAPGDVTFDGVNILVIDDESDARNLIKRLLEDRHAIVTTADSVASAMELLRTSAFDAIVSDIGMPGQDGYALVRQLRAADPATPFARTPAIALTAYARDKDRQQALAAGFCEHLTKPIDITPC